METTKRGSLWARLLVRLVSAAGWCVLALALAWAFGALWFDMPGVPRLAAGLFAVAVVAACVWLRPVCVLRWALAGAFLAVLVWWLSLKPSQGRNWKPEVAKTAHAEVAGDTVVFHNVRNFDYRAADDFTERWETRRYDLNKLRGADLFITYWGSPYMAHPILSFDFGDGGRICFSIETRPERGESYSALGGIYRQFELCCVAADERDVIRLRSNYRKGEDVYLYHIKMIDPRATFLEYVRMANGLHEAPRWYNAVTNNCTTALRQQRAAGDRKPWDWRMLVNGFGDEMLYEKGFIDRSVPFAELKRRALINGRARTAGQSPDFSKQVRDGVPGM